MPPTKKSSRLETFWRERVLGLLIGQLKQGITPEKIALTIALGLMLGIFPIFGVTTLLCLGAGILLKLNQPILQMVNYLVSGLQLAMILMFVRIGEFVVRAQPVSFSISEMFQKFHKSPLKFFQEFGMTGLHGIVGWLITAPFVGALLYFILVPLMRKLATTLTDRN